MTSGVVLLLVAVAAAVLKAVFSTAYEPKKQAGEGVDRESIRVVEDGDRFGGAGPDEVHMPERWNDAAGWEAWHRASVAPGKWDRMRAPDEALVGTVEAKRAEGLRRVWVPGCGRSPMGRVIAHLGMEVVATDVSPSAVQHQQWAKLDLSHLGPPDPYGSFVARVHDFITDSGDSPDPDSADWIVNEAAIQGFEGDDLRRAAEAHARVLRAGGEAWFVTQNVQGEHRDVLEGALEAAGFVVPYSALYRAYRAALKAVDPDYFEILGMPHGKDRKRLQAVLDRFVPVFEAAREAEEARAKGARVAVVIYNTG